MLVWLIDWQIAEDHILVSSGGVVDWTVYPTDTAWVTRLFGNRLTVQWQLDTYGDGVAQTSRHVQGRVTALHSVRCRQIRSVEGIVPVRGAADLDEVNDTSASWVRDAGPPHSPSPSSDGGNFGWRSYSSIFDEGDKQALYGYIVTIDESLENAASPRSSSTPKSAR